MMYGSREFPGASYDRWKTTPPENDDEDFDARADDESLFDSLDASFEMALARDEVAVGFHRFGPYVVEVFANGDVDLVSTLVLPARVGWEPAF